MKYSSLEDSKQTKSGYVFCRNWRGIAILILIVFALCEVELAQYQPSRIIDLKIVADEDFRQDQGWHFRVRQLVEGSSKKLERYFGIKLKIKSVGCWFPGEGYSFLTDLFADLIERVNKRDCDVVLGLTSRRYHDGDYFGFASYDRGYILIRRLGSDSLMRFALEHELCHLLGALDRSEGDTIMNGHILGKGSEFDGLTTELVLLNKFRNFEINLSPLSKSKLNDVISLYSQLKVQNQAGMDINLLLATLHLENGEYEAALEECRLMRNINPTYPGIHSIVGRAYLLNGEIDEAVKELETACKSMPGDYQAHSNLASAYLKQGEIEKAVKECYATIQINPGDANAYSCLAYAFLKKEKRKDAKAACHKAISLDPHLPEPHNLLGIIFVREGRVEEARFEFLKSLGAKPDYLEAHVNLGIMYFKENLFPEAAQHYKKVIEIDPDFSQAYYTLAVIYFFRKDYSAAREYLKKAENLGVEISPNFKRDLLSRLEKK